MKAYSLAEALSITPDIRNHLLKCLFARERFFLSPEYCDKIPIMWYLRTPL